ncbi:biotin operon repressor [Paenibacillus rhizosphaerae]|uniref:Biotin operon repressor n=1 Tax=Paenibacillus rhizosphaerae TaxID=297318 RepID=A0A839TKG9_9BACL|nr:biotin operon repressor [Paenibacillus rhizosphaerae]
MHKVTVQELAGSERDVWDEVQQLRANGSKGYDS